jgi:hypothetical protein
MSPREITFHHVDGSKHRHPLHAINGVNRYRLHWGIGDIAVDLVFQHGPRYEEGGVTNEQLLAVVIDRLEYLHDGGPEHALALARTRTALQYLQARTRDRVARGVD